MKWMVHVATFRICVLLTAGRAMCRLYFYQNGLRWILLILNFSFKSAILRSVNPRDQVGLKTRRDLILGRCSSVKVVCAVTWYWNSSYQNHNPRQWCCAGKSVKVRYSYRQFLLDGSRGCFSRKLGYFLVAFIQPLSHDVGFGSEVDGHSGPWTRSNDVDAFIASEVITLAWVTTHVYPQPRDVNELPNLILVGYNLSFWIPIVQPLSCCSWIRS